MALFRSSFTPFNLIQISFGSSSIGLRCRSVRLSHKSNYYHIIWLHVHIANDVHNKCLPKMLKRFQRGRSLMVWEVFFCASRHIWAIIIASSSNYYLNYSQLVTLPWQHTKTALGIFVISSTETKHRKSFNPANPLMGLSWCLCGPKIRVAVCGTGCFFFSTL